MNVTTYSAPHKAWHPRSQVERTLSRSEICTIPELGVKKLCRDDEEAYVMLQNFYRLVFPTWYRSGEGFGIFDLEFGFYDVIFHP